MSARQTEVLVIGAGPGTGRIVPFCGTVGCVRAVACPPWGNF